MKHFGLALGLTVLAASSIPAQDALLLRPPSPSNPGLDAMKPVNQGVELSFLVMSRELQIHTLHAGTLFLFAGPALASPIRFQGIELNVGPEFLLPLGVFGAGDGLTLFVPKIVGPLYAESLLFPPDFTIMDSNVVALQGALLKDGTVEPVNPAGVVDGNGNMTNTAPAPVEPQPNQAADRADTWIQTTPIAPVTPPGDWRTADTAPPVADTPGNGG